MSMPVESTNPYTLPPPPVPTPSSLAQADAYTAGRSIDAMTPEQQATLTAEVADLGVGARSDLLNTLAAGLDAEQLQRLDPVFGADEVLAAVQTRSPATVREAYEQQAGAGPATTTAEPSGRSTTEQVDAAAGDYAERVQGQAILSQHALGDLMVANAGDPAYLAELVRLAKEDGVLEQVVSPVYGGLYEQDGNGGYVVTNANASFDADGRREAFALAIGAAVDRGVLSETDVRTLGNQAAGWADVAGRAGIGQVGATEATRATAADLDSVLGDYTAAADDVTRLDETLGGLLAQAGPMTPEQQAAFVTAFRTDPENAGTYERLTEATAALADHVTGNRDAVLDAAVRDPAVAEQVAEAMTGLAKDGRGEEVLALLTEINAGGPTSALAEAFAGFDELSGPVLEDAASSAMAQLLERNNGDVSAASAQFQTAFQSLLQAWPAKAGVDDFRIGSQLLDAAAAGDVRALQGYLNQYESVSPMMRAVAGAGVLLGAVGAVNAGTNEDYVNMVAGFAQSGENAARLVAGTMGGTAAVGEAAQAAGRFAGAAGFAAKLAPGLGLIANSASLANSFNHAADGNPGYAIAMVGDVLGVMGSALEFTPVAPAGFLLSGIGAVISAAGSFAGEVINGHERRETLEKYLTAAGVDAAIIDEMISSSSQLFEMAETLDLTPEQLQSLLVTYPDIGGAPGLAGKFTDIAAACGISGDDVADFAAALAADNPNFAWDLMGISSYAPTDPGEAATFYRDYIGNTYPDAASLAETLSPDLFGDAAQARELALADYNRSGSSSTWEMDIGNLLKNNDDPAYRAEVLRLLAEDGDQRLEMFAQMTSGYGDTWSGAVRESVADAIEAGTLSGSQADMVLGYF
ncbi:MULTISPECIES: hypothetical protein [Luteimonas]|uniref:hypothetical protein n=1 Tax=Luteimonas TaxID=83614 RepID=UPI000C7D8385|nr:MULTISPECIES: hypothetical protein [Luteimonas]